MDGLFQFGLLAFISVFTMVNLIGVIPVYTGLTAAMSEKDARNVAYKTVFIALITLILFAFNGGFIFAFFQISVNSLKVVGGIIFFMAGYDMLQARFVRTKADNETVKEFAKDVAITPLAIPIISGPGAITAAIVMMNDSPLMMQKLILVFAIALVLLITLLFLLSARRIIKFPGESGNKILMRIMG